MSDISITITDNIDLVLEAGQEQILYKRLFIRSWLIGERIYD